MAVFYATTIQQTIDILKVQKLQIDRLLTERLVLIPFTLQICKNLIINDFTDLENMGIIKGNGWPDSDVMETLPRIVNNLSLVESPTGFESWMIIRRDTSEIIGDAGFKGFNYLEKNADIGYGIIEEERRRGYAEEAVLELIKWAFSSGIVKEITAECLIDNVSSNQLLQKLNFNESKRESGMLYWSLQNRLS